MQWISQAEHAFCEIRKKEDTDKLDILDFLDYSTLHSYMQGCHRVFHYTALFVGVDS